MSGQPDVAIVDLSEGSVTDYIMSRDAAELLNKHYPGHLWAVNCDGKFLDVKNLYLSGQWGFRLKVDFLHSGSDLDKKVVRAGGELLERYRLKRGRFDVGQYSQLKTDSVGRIQADQS